jgi:endonuclease/exonuclease/phosphatase (EEP) superfamily protein YafD
LPFIFLGDFNVTPTNDAYALLTGAGWHDARGASSSTSEATHMDGRRIDHVFYRGTGVTPQRPLSDHYPVYVRLRVDEHNVSQAIRG